MIVTWKSKNTQTSSIYHWKENRIPFILSISNTYGVSGVFEIFPCTVSKHVFISRLNKLGKIYNLALKLAKSLKTRCDIQIYLSVHGLNDYNVYMLYSVIIQVLRRDCCKKRAEGRVYAISS